MSKEEKKINFVDISIKIKELISTTANDKAIEVLVNKKGDEEIARRAEILDKGMLVWQSTEKDLKKCVEDQITHVSIEGKDGESELVQQRAFSDAKFKERNNLKKKLADIEVALMLAFGKEQDYSKLEEISKKAGNSGKGKPEQTE